MSLSKNQNKGLMLAMGNVISYVLKDARVVSRSNKAGEILVIETPMRTRTVETPEEALEIIQTGKLYPSHYAEVKDEIEYILEYGSGEDEILSALLRQVLEVMTPDCEVPDFLASTLRVYCKGHSGYGNVERDIVDKLVFCNV
jgi:hypothetical protein